MKTKSKRFRDWVPPPGIDRTRERIYRDCYNREREAAITTDTGVSWPVDLGESGA